MKKSKLLLFLLLVSTGILSQQHPAIKIEKSGRGAPVIFLPGFTTPGSVWVETIRHLKRSTENHVVSYAGFKGVAPIDTPWYPRIKSELLAYISQNQLGSIT